MEDRKQAEIVYYDKEAKTYIAGKKEAGSLAKFDPFLLASYQFLKKFLENDFKDKKVLDYGCGIGVHLKWLAESFQKVIGIDLSQISLDRAKEVKYENVELVVGDCENMPFELELFDVVFDGGTFSSLDLGKALKEIHRVLKPGGLLVGIETLGHNPFTNTKRKLNEVFGKRTTWAAAHIFKLQDLDVVKKYFDVVKLRFFHIISWAAFPFLDLPGGKALLKTLETIDRILLSMFPFLKRYSFKIVFILKKHD